MSKYFNPRLLNAVIAGTGMRNPVRPHVILGEQTNGFVRGDLMDANAVKEFIDQKISDLVNNAPEALDTLKELADAIQENGVADLVTKGQLEAALDEKVDKSDMLECDTNGHDYVDLGLPSGTLWATMNVGATSETEHGNYYMYGMGAKTYDSTDTPYDGTENPLDLSKDTARVVWGGAWHMPTKELMLELIDNTTQEWLTGVSPNVAGMVFTGTNGNAIFIPAGGQYINGENTIIGQTGIIWSSTATGAFMQDNESGTEPLFLTVNNNIGAGISCFMRSIGVSVRPVINTSSKYATKTDLSNYVQKSSTAGLLKNDGTVDTNTYLTQHQDLSNYALASDLQALVARVEALEQASQS